MASDDFYQFPDIRPGAPSGSQRPFDAPNFGSMGGRPAGPGAVGMISQAPMLSLGEGALGPGVPSAAPTPAAPAPATAAGPPPIAPAGSGVTINIGSAGETGGLGGRRGGGSREPQRFADVLSGDSSTAPAAPPTGGGEGETGTDRTARGTDPGSLWPDLAGGEAMPEAPPPAQLPRAPDEAEAAQLLEGQEIITPLGTARKRLGQVSDFALTPDGQESYRRATLRQRERYGNTPLDGDPAAPQPEVVPGRMEFNPFRPNGRNWILPE